MKNTNQIKDKIEERKRKYNLLLTENNTLDSYTGMQIRENESVGSSLLSEFDDIIISESSRIQDKYSKEILTVKELQDFFNMGEKNTLNLLYNNPSFPSIQLTTKRKGVTPLALVIYTLFCIIHLN